VFIIMWIWSFLECLDHTFNFDTFFHHHI
jgi:hypothetical protein